MSPGDDLGNGPAGLALLRIQHAQTGIGTWTQAADAVAAMTGGPVSGHPQTTSLYLGVPAVAFVLATTGDYIRAVDVDDHLARIVSYRLGHAHDRIDRGALPGLREYDLISGLTGLGVVCRQRRHRALLREVLGYLVRLTEPIGALPGWYYAEPPPDADPGSGHDHFTGGHLNLGLAHGIAGPLALLAIALRDNIVVPGHTEAIHRIQKFFDQWEIGTVYPWWPGRINRHEFVTGRTHQPGPQRPSWCYGTPGIARSLQLAAIALDDERRQQHVEEIAYTCATDEHQLAQILDLSLCHGWAGLLHTTARIAADARHRQLPEVLPLLHQRLRRALDQGEPFDGEGLLDGTSGIYLVETQRNIGTRTNTTMSADLTWDACLLLG